MKRSEFCGEQEVKCITKADAFLEADRPVQAAGYLNDAAAYATTKLICELLEEILTRLPEKEEA